MTRVLVATNQGLRVFGEDGQRPIELPGEPVHALTPSGVGEALAVVGSQGIWRRAPNGAWALAAMTDANIESLTLHRGELFLGCMNEPSILRASSDRKTHRVSGLDRTPGRAEWFPQGPPLSIRALTSTADGSALTATVHVGGIPRSTDGGETWHPTVPVAFDVHETRADLALAHWHRLRGASSRRVAGMGLAVLPRLRDRPRADGAGGACNQPPASRVYTSAPFNP